ncbi:uncharacterized protein N7483_002462 [Penicillium malachiteum]|uniref:uncharacterized protein n=1 Tax=Penicillium malachiteum TaxID=1324776 RepID=UPI0025470628|nr:uncharacterized protein N7483_002462 [Penicillium malachiteum]KAJ5737337.1 hypothetical protein N7483_002462 [Penicillium malachiteum]
MCSLHSVSHPEDPEPKDNGQSAIPVEFDSSGSNFAAKKRRQNMRAARDYRRRIQRIAELESYISSSADEINKLELLVGCLRDQLLSITPIVDFVRRRQFENAYAGLVNLPQVI